MNELLQQPKLDIDIVKIPNMKCPSCNGQLFTDVVVLKELSPLITGRSAPSIIPVTLYQCVKCGAIPELFQNLVQSNLEP